MLKLFRYLKPYRAAVVVTMVLVFANSIAQLSLPAMMATIVDDGIAKGDVAHILRTGMAMLGIALAGVAANVAAGYLASLSSMGFGRDLRSQVFARVTSFSLRGLDRFGTSSLITRSTNDVTQVQQLTFMIQRMMVMAPFMAIGGIIMALSTEPRLSWILLITIPLMIIFIALLMSKAVPLFKSIQTKID
ncbi:MAG: ABC transporter ATP-binding protein, partial [Pontiellaceae bacterium]|nr:ABC transporter ATP-binding protein [Pontiellaceae bacterium]